MITVDEFIGKIKFLRYFGKNIINIAVIILSCDENVYKLVAYLNTK